MSHRPRRFQPLGFLSSFFFIFVVAFFSAMTPPPTATALREGPTATPTTTASVCAELQAVIGTDAGDRGMKSLVVEGDLGEASELLGSLGVPSRVLVLSGFPCCVDESPPTETDGPPGTCAIARAAAAMGHSVTVVTDDCNKAVFAAALEGMPLPEDSGSVGLETFPQEFSEADEDRFQNLAASCGLVVACERAGPAADGNSYTMRGISMTERGLIAPLHRLFTETDCPTVAIGDGGNELGMGKVFDQVANNPKISNGATIGCVVAADRLVAASVSNWGGYALAAGAALASARARGAAVGEWVDRCLPTERDERALLDRCVAAGCRDGVTGKKEATVDGMPLETSLECLRDVRRTALSAGLGGNTREE